MVSETPSWKFRESTSTGGYQEITGSPHDVDVQVGLDKVLVHEIVGGVHP